MPEGEIKKIDSPDNGKEEINKSEQLKLDKMDPELVAKKLEDQEKAKDEKQKKVLDVFDHSPSAKLQTVDQYKNNIQILVNGLNSGASGTQEMNNAFVDYKDKNGKIIISDGELTEIASKIYEKQRTALLVDLKNSQSGIANPSKDLSTLNDNELNEMRINTGMNSLSSKLNPNLIYDLQDEANSKDRQGKNTQENQEAQQKINEQLSLFQEIRTLQSLGIDQITNNIINDIKASNNGNSFDRIISSKDQDSFYLDLARSLRQSNLSNVEDIKLAIINTIRSYTSGQDPERAVSYITPIVFKSIVDSMNKYTEQSKPNEEPKEKQETPIQGEEEGGDQGIE